MPESENWVLFQFSTATPRNVHSIGNNIFRKALQKSVFYAFISLPFTNANVNIGTPDYGMSLERRIENIVKGLLSENLIISLYSQNSPFIQNNYLIEYPQQTSYWEKDICDSVKISITSEEIISQVDIKGLHINWGINQYPTIEEINQMELRRSNRCPNQDIIVEKPLIMLLESPWRHFYKLKTQYETYRRNRRVKFPHENLCFLSPRFNFSNLNENDELLTLYEQYYENFYNTSNRRENFIRLTRNIPHELQIFIQNATRFPESINWLINNWNQIEVCLGRIIEELMIELDGFWIWVFGFVDQQSAEHFKKVYQNDWISYNEINIWSSATRSPHEKKWTNYKKGKRKSRPFIAGDDHPYLYWNNNTIDISTEWVSPIEDNL